MTPHDHRDEGMSDEQFCTYLTRDANAAGDAAEAEEAAKLRAALTSYRTETLLWAERRSAAMPPLAPAARRKRLMAAVPQWTLAALAVMTVAVGVVHFNNQPQETAEVDTSATVTRTMGTTPSQMEDDNALLTSIDAAVHAGAGLPVTALGLEMPHTDERSHGSME